MTHCFICECELTNDDDKALRCDSETCRDKYRTLLRYVGTTEYEIKQIQLLPGDDLTEALKLFQQSLKAKQLSVRQRAFISLRRHAARAEAKLLGLTHDETVEYVRRRMNGDSADELRYEIESANRGIENERELYLATGVRQLLYALMERADSEINRVKERNFIAGKNTDDRALATGMQVAVVTAIAYSDASCEELIELAVRQGWGRVQHFIQRNEGWIEHDRRLVAGIRRRLTDSPSSVNLKLVA